MNKIFFIYDSDLAKDVTLSSQKYLQLGIKNFELFLLRESRKKKIEEIFENE